MLALMYYYVKLSQMFLVHSHYLLSSFKEENRELLEGEKRKKEKEKEKEVPPY
jgi:hypothetical protein